MSLEVKQNLEGKTMNTVYPFKNAISREEALAFLHEIGLNKHYKIDVSGEQGLYCIDFQTRKPMTTGGGVAKGTAIDLYSKDAVRVWTTRKQLANSIAREHGFKISNADGEAMLYVPCSRADEFLGRFGAKVKHSVSPEYLEMRREIVKKARDARSNDTDQQNSQN